MFLIFRKTIAARAHLAPKNALCCMPPTTLHINRRNSRDGLVHTCTTLHDRTRLNLMTETYPQWSATPALRHPILTLQAPKPRQQAHQCCPTRCPTPADRPRHPQLARLCSRHNHTDAFLQLRHRHRCHCTFTRQTKNRQRLAQVYSLPQPRKQPGHVRTSSAAAARKQSSDIPYRDCTPTTLLIRSNRGNFFVSFLIRR